MIFKCPRCKYVTNKRHNMYKHLIKKNKCLVTNEDISIDECMEILFKERNDNMSSNIICKYCGKHFKEMKILKQHLSRYGCQVSKEIEKDKIIKKLIDDNHKLKNEINLRKIIKINDFTKENTEYIDGKYIRKIVSENPISSIVKLLGCIYFNQEHFENHTIYLSKKENNNIMITRNGNWVLNNKIGTIDTITKKIIDIIEKECYDNNSTRYTKMCIDFKNRDKNFINNLYNKIESKILAYQREMY